MLAVTVVVVVADVVEVVVAFAVVVSPFEVVFFSSSNMTTGIAVTN